MNTQKEVWKDVPNYKGYYQVSNLGRVKSLDRIIQRYKTLTSKRTGVVLSSRCSGKYYLTVVLNKLGKRETFSVHRLVAICFLNHAGFSDTKLVVDHIDNNKLNNNVNNLQIVSNRLNSSKDRVGYSSKYVGVSLDNISNTWGSYIYINGKRKYLGRFENEIDAHNAYQNELKGIK